MEGVCAPLSRRDQNFNGIFLLSGDRSVERRRGLYRRLDRVQTSTYEMHEAGTMGLNLVKLLAELQLDGKVDA